MLRLTLTEALQPHAERVGEGAREAVIRRRPQRAKLPSSSSPTPTKQGTGAKQKTLTTRRVRIEDLEPAWVRRQRERREARIEGIERIIMLGIEAGWLIAMPEAKQKKDAPIELDWYRMEYQMHSLDRAAWLLGVSTDVLKRMRLGEATSARAECIVDGLLRKEPSTFEEAHRNAYALRQKARRKS